MRQYEFKVTITEPQDWVEWDAETIERAILHGYTALFVNNKERRVAVESLSDQPQEV